MQPPVHHRTSHEHTPIRTRRHTGNDIGREQQHQYNVAHSSRPCVLHLRHGQKRTSSHRCQLMSLSHGRTLPPGHRHGQEILLHIRREDASKGFGVFRACGRLLTPTPPRFRDSALCTPL